MNIKYALYWLTAVTILTLVVFYLGWEEVISTLGQADPAFLTGLFLMKTVTMFLVAYRWHYLFRKTNQNLTFPMTLAITMTGSFVENVTPSSRLGGEATKVYLFHRYTSLTYTNLGGIFLAIKYFSLIPFLVIVSASLILAFLRYQLPPVIFLAFLLLVLFFLVLAWMHHMGGKRKEKSGTCDHGTQAGENAGKQENTDINTAQRIILFLKKKTAAAVNFLQVASIHSRSFVTNTERFTLLVISTLIWVLYPVKVYLVVYMLGFNIDIVTISIIAFTAYLMSLIPVSPGGLGIYEGSMVFLFSLAGFSPAEGLAVALLSRLVVYWFPLLIYAMAASYLALMHGSLSPADKKNL